MASPLPEPFCTKTLVASGLIVKRKPITLYPYPDHQKYKIRFNLNAPKDLHQNHVPPGHCGISAAELEAAVIKCLLGLVGVG